MMENVSLRSLHPEGSLSQPKLATFRKLSTEDLIDSLRPGGPGGLKVKVDGDYYGRASSHLRSSRAWCRS
jgi:hypothetical protein